MWQPLCGRMAICGCSKCCTCCVYSCFYLWGPRWKEPLSSGPWDCLPHRKKVPNPSRLVISICFIVCDHLHPVWFLSQKQGRMMAIRSTHGGDSGGPADLDCLELSGLPVTVKCESAVCILNVWWLSLMGGVCGTGWHAGLLIQVIHHHTPSPPWHQTSGQPTNLGNSSAPQSILCL